MSWEESQMDLSNGGMVGLLAQGIISHHNCLLSNECEMSPIGWILAGCVSSLWPLPVFFVLYFLSCVM